MDVISIIKKYYPSGSQAYSLLLKHSRLVTEKALHVAGRVRSLGPDLNFIEEASMLHDIGIFLTNAPHIGCYGDRPYICHGYLGRELLEKEGLQEHAAVCERHVGAGLTVSDIQTGKLPLPLRAMAPVTLEEKIICFADKFYSKVKDNTGDEKTISQIRSELRRYGAGKLQQFEEWLVFFKEPEK
ncbi:MAG TPA: HD domain-containing protein [Dissulfurispiraceae bacterium]|nr:HD domain-containing protein [Dissulfurispiraceae bacterium]